MHKCIIIQIKPHPVSRALGTPSGSPTIKACFEKSLNICTYSSPRVHICTPYSGTDMVVVGWGERGLRPSLPIILNNATRVHVATYKSVAWYRCFVSKLWWTWNWHWVQWAHPRVSYNIAMNWPHYSQLWWYLWLGCVQIFVHAYTQWQAVTITTREPYSLLSTSSCIINAASLHSSTFRQQFL